MRTGFGTEVETDFGTEVGTGFGTEVETEVGTAAEAAAEADFDQSGPSQRRPFSSAVSGSSGNSRVISATGSAPSGLASGRCSRS